MPIEDKTPTRRSLTVVLLWSGVLFHMLMVPAFGQTMYWIDALYGTIERADLDGSNRNVVISTGNATGIAIDPVAGKVYWTGDNPRIGRANLDGSNIEILVPQAANPTFMGISLDLTNRKMYWVDMDGQRAIKRANFDGSSIESIVSFPLSEPRGIAVDSAGGKVYWTDIGTNDVRRANLDGTSVEVLVDFPVAIEPLSIALDLFGQKMYWGDLSTRLIMRANLDGTNVQPVVDLPDDSHEAWGIAVNASAQMLYWSCDGSVSTVRRANIDGSNVETLVAAAASFRGIGLDLHCFEDIVVDCNQNGILDECDIANCPPEDSTCQDCDADGVMNGCEPPGGYCESNTDCDDGHVCTLDECNPIDCTCIYAILDPCCEPTGACPCSIGCENWGFCCDSLTNTCLPPGVPQPVGDPTPPKTRFLSMSITTPPSGTQQAIRVTLTSLHHVEPPYTGAASVPFTNFEYGVNCEEGPTGCVRWVGAPAQYRESTANATMFMGATLQCTPHYQDWSTVGLVHVTGAEIVPSSVYDVQAFDISCQSNEANCMAVSCATQMRTSRWGDIETPYNPPSPTTQPDLGDISALVNKFRSAPGAPIKAWAKLQPAVPNMATDVDFSDISMCVDAFRGLGYPFVPAECP